MIAPAVIERLLRWGVSEVVLAAGARNLPLAVAAMRASHLRCWNHFEERSAGFFALGRTRATGQPVAVITTSGTAVAELLPAMIEAHYQGRPLLALTADRPPEYRGTGAPQAIEQRAIFGRYADWFDLLDEQGLAVLPEILPASPLHLNICLEEPNAAELERIPELGMRPSPPHAPLRLLQGTEAAEEFLLQTGVERGLVVVGPLAPEAAAPVAEMIERLRRPVLAEGISNLPWSERLEALLVREDEVDLGGLDCLLRIGGIPTARLWRDLEESEVVVAHVTDQEFTGLARGGEILCSLPLPMPEQALVGQGKTTGPVAEITGEDDPELAVVAALAKAIPRNALVFLGNSLPVREWNRVFPLGKHRCYANRGANGIDGNLSTFLGLAHAEKTEAWCLVGDLTALYDLAAPFVLGQLKLPPRLRIVILNNGGGRIFSRLPSLGGLEKAITGAVENSHGISFAGMADLWGLRYRRLSEPEEIEGLGEDGAELWEIVLEAG